QQHLKLERLRNVIICPQFQPQDLIQLSPAGGNENNWNIGLTLEAAERLYPIHAGQADIQQDQIRWIELDQFQGIFSVSRRGDVEAIFFQVKGHTPPHQLIVIYQQDIFRHASSHQLLI